MSEELKPCPFCGSDELSHGWSAPGYDGSMSTGNVECHNCNALIYTAGGEIEAIAAWNTRIPDPRIAELEAALKEAQDALRLYTCYPCPVCNGDCSSANPPVYACPAQAAYWVLHRQALKGPDHD